MLVRPLPAPRSVALPRLSAARRPRLVARHPSLYISHPSNHRLLTAKAELLSKRRRTTQDTYAHAHGSVFQRSLATAISDPIRQDEIPFDHLQSQSHAANNYIHPPSYPHLYDIRSFDPSRPLLVKDEYEPPPRSKMNVNGIPGGMDEMLSFFDACIQVGKLERASLVLKRLTDMGGIPGHELIRLHNRYLRVSIERAFEQPDSKWAQSLHKWYELHIKGARLPQTPETIACMLKISLISAQGARLQRLVDRYMGMMPGDAIYQVLSEVDILSQQDFGIIASIYKPASNLLEELEYTQEGEAPQSLDAEAGPTQSTTPETQAESGASPEVLAVDQKGLGLKSLKEVLSFFDKIKGQDISNLSRSERREIQARLEQDCVEAAISRWREENENLKKIGLNSSLSTNALNSQLYEWQCALENKLEEEFARFEESETRERKNEEDQNRCLYAPYLSQSNPTRLAAVTIISVLNTLSSIGADNGVQLSLIITHLSKTVEDDIRHQLWHAQTAAGKAKAMKAALKASRKKKSGTEPPTVQPPAEPAGPVEPAEPAEPAEPDTNPNVIKSSMFEVKAWPMLIRTKVSIVLLSALMDVAKVTVVREHPETKALVSQRQPALAHTLIHRKGKKVGLVLPNKFLVELLKREPPAEFLARHLPMIAEPEPWTQFDRGGFIEFPAQLVRIKNHEKDQRVYAEAAFQRGDMEQVSKGLDVLGRTGWRINRPVFDVMLDVWNTGEALANIPPLDPKLPIPPEPEASDNPLKRKEWLKTVKAIENEKSGLHSERCFMNFQLEIAQSFKDQTFYFPHNMDFRGRAYPIPTYLNHMGADHVRGLLRFAKGRELGESGLRWLKIHLANVFGYDKASLKEREAFVADNLAEIYDSATNPLTGTRWWLQAEDPWQCLATCFELKAALDSPDPTKFVSHLPVHQDGTCNGLQHYAALGGDLWGAQQVNLEPGDRPADVYSAVAELVKESIAEDVEAGSLMAKAVDGKITRKVVKQTVMTNVYGVTFIGAKAQVKKQLDAAYPDIEKDTGMPLDMLAAYIAGKIFKALSTMFRGAHDIQYWLGECAGRICRALAPEQIERIAKGETGPTRSGSRVAKKAQSAIDQLLSQCRSTVVWTTPLRMPIVQPYRKSETRVISTSMQDLILQVPERSDPVNRRKQLQAFPPNFIHSLDASHMILSALQCDELGLTFAAVHDSFWTHASDVDVMNRVLRDSFIRIHTEDVIGRLSSEFQARYKGSLYFAKLDQSTLVAKEIIALRKSRKLQAKAELLEEYERSRLLASSDPEEVKKGQAMVTPASIVEKMSATEPLSSAEEVEAIKLGNIPEGDAAASEAILNEENDDEEDYDDMVPIPGSEKPNKGSASTMESEKADGDKFPALIGKLGSDELQTMLGTSRFEIDLSGKMTEARKKARAKSNAKKTTFINVWLPLTFPEVPKKGDFDVSRLKDSQYFFS